LIDVKFIAIACGKHNDHLIEHSLSLTCVHCSV